MTASTPGRHAPAAGPVSLASLWWMFLRIACAGFGGYMAMVSAMQQVVVERRRLMPDHDVLDGVSLASTLPGPVAINAVAYVGYRLRGLSGAFVCVCAAVMPAFLLMLALSAAYLRWGHMPAIGRVFMGLMPVVAAIMAASAWNMGRKALSGWREAALAAMAAAALLGFGGMYTTFATICGAGLLGRCCFRGQAHAAMAEKPESVSASAQESTVSAGKPVSPVRSNLLALAGSPQLFACFTSVDPHLLLKLFFTFAWMSMFLFGGAYVFVPLLKHAVVEGHGWVTPREFADAVAMGQLMPGPAVISVVFVGFKTAGIPGAVAAAAGIFLPSAALMISCMRLFDRLKASAGFAAALRGVRAAVVGMVFAAALMIGRTAPASWISAALFLAAFGLLLRYRIDAVWLVPPAGLIGFFLY